MNLEPYTAKTIVTSRSKFQLRHFVVGQHDTPQMQWRQILIEAQDMAYKIRLAEINIEKTRIEIERLIATGDPIDALDAEEKRMGMVLTERTLAGARLELEWLQELAEEIGPYSFEDIENNQQEYWVKRLQRQADTDVFALQSGVSVANAQSMLNVGILKNEEQPCAISPGS